MEKRIDLTWNPELKGKGDTVIFETAKALIEEKGIKTYVLEQRQLSCMGGAGYAVVHKRHLDTKYIGYRGFLTYAEVCEQLEGMKKREKEQPTDDFDLESFIKKILDKKKE